MEITDWRAKWNKVHKTLRGKAMRLSHASYGPDKIEEDVHRTIDWRNKFLRAEVADNKATADIVVAIVKEILEMARQISHETLGNFVYDYDRKSWRITLETGEPDDDKVKQIERKAVAILARENLPASFMYIHCR